MNAREEDQLNPIDLDQGYDHPKNEADLNQRMDQLQEKVAEKFDDINQTVKYEMITMQEKLGFQGNRTQVYQQTALIVTVIQIIISTYLAMLVSQISFLGKAWTFIPGFRFVCWTLYAMCIIGIQYFPEKVQQPRYNFAVGTTFAICKNNILVFLTIRFFDIRVEVFLVSLIFLLGFIASKIYIPTQRQEEFDLRLKYIWKKMTLFQFFSSFFLMFFTRSDFIVGLLVFVVTLTIGLYTVLGLERFKEHQYLSQHSNDIYLGALQLEADLLLPCGLIKFFISSRTRPNSLSIKSDDKLNEEVEKAQSEQKVRIQSAHSIAEI